VTRMSCEKTYVDSWRKRFTLCIVMRAVGDEEIMMIGYMFPVRCQSNLDVKVEI